MKRMEHKEHRDPNFYRHLRAEFSDGWRWLDRALVLAYGALAGGVVVVFTVLSHMAYEFFSGLYTEAPGWLILFWTPLVTAGVVWLTLRFVPLAAGSGIPQVMAALDPELDDAGRSHFVSIKLTIGKVLLASAGLLGGLSAGREGPSVQVAAGVLQHSRRWLRHRQGVANTHSLLVAGGAAGIAAAFNAPLAGVVFALEELSRQMESRYSGVIIASIVLAGLMGVSMFGNAAYFGTVQVPPLSMSSILPGIVVAVGGGLAGGLMAKLLAASLGGQSSDRFSVWRRQHPIRFAVALGLVIAVIGMVSGGMTFGSGTEAARELLHAEHPINHADTFGVLKFVATGLTAWTGVPGGLFAPSLSVGAGIGYNVSTLLGYGVNTGIIAMGMTAFLAAVTQAPLTAFIIVMELIDGRPMVLSLMAVAMVAATISRMISRPLYETLSKRMLDNYRAKVASAAPPQELPAPAAPSPEAATTPPEPSSPQTPPVPPSS